MMKGVSVDLIYVYITNRGISQFCSQTSRMLA